MFIKKERVHEEYLRYIQLQHQGHCDAVRLTAELFFMLPEEVEKIVATFSEVV